MGSYNQTCWWLTMLLLLLLLSNMLSLVHFGCGLALVVAWDGPLPAPPCHHANHNNIINHCRRRREFVADTMTTVSLAVVATTTGASCMPRAATGYTTLPGTTSQENQELDCILLPRSSNFCLPKIGYSLYKTPPEQVEEGVGLALQAGTRHLDVASFYGTNEQVGNVLKRYIETGQVETKQNGITTTISSASSSSSSSSQQPLHSKEERRNHLVISHKVSNAEQALKARDLKRNLVLQQSKLLGGKAVDLALIHSPLTDRNRRLSTYATLCELQAAGKVRAVGVCHYGVTPLQEIMDAGLPAPSVIQLELSPFHQHKDVAAWATVHGSILSCAAWSKLSSANGPTQGWDTLAKIAQGYNNNNNNNNTVMTKQQVLIRWALQRGYVCVPRSSSKYKVERAAIVENSWPSIQRLPVLSEAEMSILNGLDEQITAGQLQVLDGWDESDIVSNTWDPTTAI